MELKDFIFWLVFSGGNISIVSWICERWQWYQLQTKDKKEFLFFGAAFIIAVTGYAVNRYVPANVISEIAPYFGIAYTTFCSVFIGNAFHKLDKK